MASFTRKRLRATLILTGANQTFQGTNSNTLVLENLRMKANLTWGGNWTNFLDLTIYGMRQADMNALTVLWYPPITQVNVLPEVILESYFQGGWVQIFSGNFLQAQPDYQAIPDACMTIYSSTGYGQQLAKYAPSSYTGGTSAVTIAQSLAKAMGFTLENNGVTAQLNTPYFSGTLMDQFRQLCDHANIDYYFLPNATIAICPKNQQRQGQAAVVLSASTGLIGYPTVGQYGPVVRCLFNPNISLGAPIQLQSDVPGANGTYFPTTGTHQLETWTPKGAWFSEFQTSTSSAVAS